MKIPTSFGQATPILAVLLLLSLLGGVVWWEVRPEGQSTASLRPTPAPGAQQTIASQNVPPPKQVKFTQSKPRALPDIDGRELTRQVALPPNRAKALEELRREIPGVQVEFDPLSTAPSYVQATGRLLTQPAPPGTSSRQVVEQFVERHQVLFGHSGTDLGKARLEREDVTEHSGMATLVWQQQLDEIPVFKTILKANVTKNGELVTISDHFLSNPERATKKDAVQRRSMIHQPAVPAEQAVAQAAASWDERVATVAAVGEAAGAERRQAFAADGLSDTRAHLTWMPMSNSHMVLAWDVTTFSLAQKHMYRVVVAAETGKVLYRTSLTVDISNATFQVYAKPGTFQPYDSPTPMAPGLAAPSSTQPATVERETLTLQALNTTASPNGWINDGGTETLGNNVDAHTDSDDNNVADLPRPNGGAGRNFSFPLDLTQSPATYRDAAVTQLFYLNNYIHDRFYDLGFTESAGNFQTDNFSRGGYGNDAVEADAQDGSGTDNANFSTPPDGYPGRMQMYVFTGPTPARDGDLDAEIVIHEYTHGLSNRLVGGGVGISELQSSGMGEGWSDFYALCLLSEPGDDPHGNYASGAYATHQFYGLAENYYFGIRRYPYSTNLTANPLTFKDIDPFQASAHSGIPNNPVFGPPNVWPDEVHNQGEVWCVTLWEARANLIAKYGHAVGNQRILQLTTDGMKLCPVDPTFIQARDAILQADLINNGGVDRNTLWAAFAKRGMGATAIAPETWTTTGVVESFDVPDDLKVTPQTPLASAGQVHGPMTPDTHAFLLKNSGTGSLLWTATANQPWLTLSLPSGTLEPGATAAVMAAINEQANYLPPGNHTATVSFNNVGSGMTLQRMINLQVDPLLIPILTENFESGTLSSAWALTGTGNWRTLNTTANGPHGGSRHLTMDAKVNDIYSRNESTVTVDLAGRSNVRLLFQAKGFNDEPDGPPSQPFPEYGEDFDGVAISADGGSNWFEVQDLRSLTNDWQRYVVDLDAALQANGLTYTANFKIRFNHFDNYPIPTDGIAIDDILIAEANLNQLQLAGPESLAEGGNSGTITVTLTPAPAADLTVTLAANGGDATVPPTVVVPAGATFVTFAVTPTNDSLLDGSQTVMITASAPGYPDAATNLLVHDNEITSLAVSVPASLTEGNGIVQGSLTLGAATGAPVRVFLTSSSPGNLAVPASVMVPTGSTGVPLPLSVVDDLLLDGAQAATITAHVQGWSDASAGTVINDNDQRTLTLVLPRMREGDGVVGGTVLAGGILTSALTVTLQSSDLSEAEVPATVVIPAGSRSAAFELTVQDDDLQDGTQPVTISAAATGFTAASVTDDVEDNEIHHLVVTLPPGQQIRGAAFPLTITAVDLNGAVVTNYEQPIDLSAEGEAGPVAFMPLISTQFEGVWHGSVTVDEFASDVVIMAHGGDESVGYSEPFDVGTGPMDHFAWDPLVYYPMEDQRFAVTARAVDAGNNPVDDFQGTAGLGVKVPGTVELLMWGGYSDGTDPGFEQAFGALTTFLPNVNRTDSSTTDPATLAAELDGKHVLLIPTQSMARPGDMAALGTAWTPVLNQFVQDGGVIIVCSYERDEHMLLSSSGLMALTKGLITSSLPLTQAGAGPLTEGVFTPFIGSGISTFTDSNGEAALQSTVDGNPVVLSRAVGAGRVVVIGCGFTEMGTEMDKVIANAARLGDAIASPVLAVRGGPAEFVDGVWSGEIAIPFAASGVSLVARAESGRESLSDPFDVAESPLPEEDGTTIFTENFESGTLSNAWSITGTGPHRTRVTTENGAYGGAKHLVMDSAVDGTYARNEATLTLNLENRSGIQFSFYVKGINDEGHTPPDEGIGPNGADFDGVAISGDGGQTWFEVLPLRDLYGSYDRMIIDLDSAAGAFGLSYTTDFKIRFNHYDNFRAPADGIAIDDILVTANYTEGLGIQVPAEAGEADGMVTGTVTLGFKREADTLVVLQSSRPMKAGVPDSVVIPAGELEATFPINLANDTFFEGNRRVTFTAAPIDEMPSRASMTVIDDETTTITVTTQPWIDEGSWAQGAVRLGAPPLGPIQVTLVSSSPEGIVVPETVTVPGGTRTAVFDIAAEDNEIIDVNRVETVTASIAGGASDIATIAFIDNEWPTLSVWIPGAIDEGTTDTAFVNVAAPVSSPLVVQLTATNPARLTLPETVTIPAGADTAAFPISAPDNAAMEGEVWVGLSAAVAGFYGDPAIIAVHDNEVDHYIIEPIGDPQVANAPIAVRVQGLSIDGLSVNKTGTMLAVTATSDSGPLAVTPTTIGPFVGYELNATVRVPSVATGVILTVTDAAMASATSNPFNTVIGGLDHFQWSVIPSPQMKGAGFTATLSARDAGGTLLTDYSGSPDLSAHTPGGAEVITGNVEMLREGPFSYEQPVARMQSIYLPSEIGPARSLTNLALDMYDVPFEPLQEFTVRMKHTSKANFDTAPTWETNNWTTVYSGTLTVTDLGWVTLPFNVPFAYNGTDNLMVDISFRNETAEFAPGGSCSAKYTETSRTLRWAAAPPAGDPLTWTATTPEGVMEMYVPNLRFLGHSCPLTPESVALVNGTWTGTITLGGTGDELVLSAFDGTTLGESNTFAVGSLGSLALMLPATATEGDLPLNGIVSLPEARLVDTVITLSSSAESQAAPVSPTVTIPAGSLNAPFQIIVVDDGVPDGSQNVTITASSTHHENATAQVLVHDNDAGTITVDLLPDLYESLDPPLDFGMLSLPAPSPTDITVALTSSAPSQLRVPATATILAGTDNVVFSMEVINDFIGEDLQEITITARVVGWPDATGITHVHDDDLHHLQVGLINSPQTVDSPVPVEVIAMTSDGMPVDYSSPLTITATATGGSMPIVFSEPPALLNGYWYGEAILKRADTNVVLKTTDSLGFTGSSNAFDIIRGGPDHFTWANVPSPQMKGVPFPATLAARDSGGNFVEDYEGEVALSAHDAGAGIVTGEAASEFPFPLSTMSKSVSRTQSIYLPSEIGPERTLRNLSVHINGFPAAAIDFVTIRLKHTNRTHYDTDISWESTGWTTVYEGPLSATENEWLTIPFAAAFAYNGTSNLMVDICVRNSIPEAYGTCSASMTDEPRTLWAAFDDSGVEDLGDDPRGWATEIPTGTPDFNLPILQFEGASYPVVPATVNMVGGSWTGTVTVLGSGQEIVLTATDMQPIVGNSNSFDVGSLGSLAVTLPLASLEGALPLSGIVTLPAEREVDTVVTLTSGDTAQATVSPATITIPAGSLAAGFTVTVVDDALVDGSQKVAINATTDFHIDATAYLTIDDNESALLSVDVPPDLIEGDPMMFQVGTVSIPMPAGAAVTVNLVSSDTTEATVPATVVIPEGASSAEFPITVVDDVLADGAQPVAITASVANWSAGTDTSIVHDNDLHHFTLEQIPSPQQSDIPFTIFAEARTIENLPVLGYNGTVTMTAAGTQGAVVVTPIFPAEFFDGAMAVDVACATADTNVQITLTDGLGHTGVSSLFRVDAGYLHHFAWAAVPSPQTKDLPFTATLTARDSAGNFVSDYAGTADLLFYHPTGVTETGSGDSSRAPPIGTEFDDARLQAIYPKEEMGPARTFTSMAFNVETLPGQRLNAFTIRLKHTGKRDYDLDGSWESSGWTTVYQGNLTIANTGWLTLPFNAPFSYNGTDSLMVDFSFNNTTASMGGSLVGSSKPNARSLYFQASGTAGNPLHWTGLTPMGNPDSFAPDLRFQGGLEAAQPTTVELVNGVFTGNVAVPRQGSGIRLVARDQGDPANIAFSNPFDVGVLGTLGLTLPIATATEGGAAVSGTVTLDAPQPSGTVVTLSTSPAPDDVVFASTSVTIPAGATSAPFSLTAVDDTELDGPRAIVLNATSPGFADGIAPFTTLDNESGTIVIDLPPSVTEGDGFLYSLITITPVPTYDVTVTLTSSAPSELKVPQTVTVLAGEGYAYFAAKVIDDNLMDGARTVTLTASVPSWTNASFTTSVRDNELHHFSFTNVPSPRQAGQEFPITIRACAIDDLTVTNFWNNLDLSAAGDGGPVTMTPGEVYLVYGEWTGNVTISTAQTNVRLATGAYYGLANQSNPFDVLAGPVHHFAWSTIASPQYAGVPIAATVTARDVANNIATSYSGTAAIEQVNNPSVVTGTGTTPWDFPLFTYYHDARTQCIYTPSEIGPSRTLTSLDLDVITTPGQTMNAFTIRMKHTTKANYSSGDGATWESSGWTTVYQANRTINTTGWNNFTFSTPFNYDGTSNLVVDISFNNNFYTSNGSVAVSSSSSDRALYYYSDSGRGDPLTWSGTNPSGITASYLPNLRFPSNQSAIPLTNATFTAGTWSGNITIAAQTPVALLRAVDGSYSGSSNGFAVLTPETFTLAVPVATASEGGAALSGTVSIAAPKASDTVFTLTSSDTTEAIPASSTVTIAAGSTTAPFSIEIVDDDIVDGSQPVVITVAAPGFIPQTASLTINDNDEGAAHHFAFSTISTPQFAGSPINVAITAQTSTNATATTFSGTVSLGAVRAGGTPVTIAPAVTASFVNGVWNGSVTITQAGADVTISANDGLGHIGTSNSFNVLDPLADLDGNGIGALLEHALNIPGGAPNARSMLPVVSLQADGGSRYLTLEYRRRIQRSGLQYNVDTSSDLRTWDLTGSSVQETSVTPLGDGITERVVVRVTPAVLPPGRKFVRLRITIQ